VGAGKAASMVAFQVEEETMFWRCTRMRGIGSKESRLMLYGIFWLRLSQ